MVSGETITDTLHHQGGYTGFSSITEGQGDYYFAPQVVPLASVGRSQSTLEMWEKELDPPVDDEGKLILIKRLKKATGHKASSTFDVVADRGIGGSTEYLSL